MENKTEDEIRKRWEVEAKERAEREEEAQQRPKKRVRAIEYNKDDGEPGPFDFDDRAFAQLKPKANAARKKTTARAASTRAQNRITEVMDEEMILEQD
jgi:hypothetical protein